MKNNPKNVKVPVIVILYLLAILFLGYGAYMAYDAVVYVNTYDTNAAVSATNMLQYVVAASASYFGFAIVIFAAAAIMGGINQVQRNIYHTLSFGAASDVSVENIAEITSEENAVAAPAEETSVDTTEIDAAVNEVIKVPESNDKSNIDATYDEAYTDPPQPLQSDEEEKNPEAEDTLNAVEASAKEQAEVQETAPADKQDHNAELEVSIQTNAQPETSVQIDTKPEETSIPLVKDFSSQFITETEQEPEPEIITQHQPAPEIIAQQQPTPEVVVRKRPSPNQPAEPVPQQQSTSEAVTEKSAAKPLPSTVPEEILQTKRKRGLKYETVAMDEKKHNNDYPRNLTDTIRLKKEDRDAISSAFIRDIFEKNE